MTTSASVNDTSAWLPLDQLEPGFDQNKAAASTALDGTEITVSTQDGASIRHRFDATVVSWTLTTPTGSDSGTDPYEAVEVDRDLFWVQFHHAHTHPDEAVSLFLDLRAGVALSVLSDILPAGTSAPCRIQHRFVPATIDECARHGLLPAPTNTLVGRRVLWRYSTEHAYEHHYISPTWYTWHCVSGPEAGQADTDEQTTYQLRPGIYVFAWREKVIPCGSVTVADHRDSRALRSHGVLFGLNADGVGRSHFTFGAYGSLVAIGDPEAAMARTAALAAEVA